MDCMASCTDLEEMSWSRGVYRETLSGSAP
jgi:hypothetical protein